jgi:hypothetical protein
MPFTGPLKAQIDAGRIAGDQAKVRIVNAVKFELGAAVREALIAGYVSMGGPLKDYLESATHGLRDPSNLEAVHKQVGKRAQDAMVRSYDQRVTARAGPASRSDPHYKTRRTRLSGTLRNALKADSHVDVKGGTLTFLDPGLLDKEAAHWYRLNFGAGERGRRGQAGLFDLIVNGEFVGALGFKTGPSKSPVIMPAGFFISADGKLQRRNAARLGLDAFFPRPPGGGGIASRPIVTQGIEARRFIDTGVRTLARELPKAWDDMIRESFAQAKGFSPEHVSVTVPGLRTRFRTVQKATPLSPTRFRRGIPQFDY